MAVLCAIGMVPIRPPAERETFFWNFQKLVAAVTLPNVPELLERKIRVPEVLFQFVEGLGVLLLKAHKASAGNQDGREHVDVAPHKLVRGLPGENHACTKLAELLQTLAKPFGQKELCFIHNEVIVLPVFGRTGLGGAEHLMENDRA